MLLGTVHCQACPCPEVGVDPHCIGMSVVVRGAVDGLGPVVELWIDDMPLALVNCTELSGGDYLLPCGVDPFLPLSIDAQVGTPEQPDAYIFIDGSDYEGPVESLRAVITFGDGSVEMISRPFMEVGSTGPDPWSQSSSCNDRLCRTAELYVVSPGYGTGSGSGSDTGTSSGGSDTGTSGG
jgi:hypothetical protein